MKKEKRIPHAIFKKELLKDPDVLAAYNALEEEYQLIREMLCARDRAGLTQQKLAKMMKTTPSVVSRLESLYLEDQPSPSLNTLKKYAHALGCRLDVKLVPDERYSDHA